MIAIRPMVALSRAAPGIDEVPGLVVFEDGRGNFAAHSEMQVCRFEVLLDRLPSLDGPHIILSIYGEAYGGTCHPMVWKRFRPVGIHFKNGRLDSGSPYSGSLAKNLRCDSDHSKV